MRFAAYAGTSMALATGIILRALHSRANFYSACVYLSQSNACLMILSNLLLLAVGSLLMGLQRFLYGPLRPIEVEQLYEKAWFAVTETCLAMTIFRDEVGAWFVVMFVSLLVGKVWGWIGEGRVEILEQQPPENPRLFHARLSTSLAVSLLFDAYLLRYSILTVQQQARPNMMVMFAFDFAVLAVNSASTCLRYAICLREAAIIKEQTNVRLEQRRQEILRQRESDARSTAQTREDRPAEIPIEELLDEADIDAPGWEEKSRWVFYLDLATDFVKLFLYLTFFCVLCMFYGMPIHIIRDVALTIRSFYKRITDFLKYRHATRDMNDRYPDATEQDIRSQDVCIICREGMRAWEQSPPQQAHDVGQTSPLDERLRPKKLPCGHILHFACLRSWLERQQNCPTCRQPVLASNPTSPTAPRNPVQGVADQGQRPAAERPGANAEPPRHDQNRVRFFNFGPIRFGFGAGHDLHNLEQQLNNHQAQHHAGRQDENVHQFGFSLGLGRQQRQLTLPQSSGQSLQSQIQNIEHQLTREIQSLRIQGDQLQVLRALQGELARLRIAYSNNGMSQSASEVGISQIQQPSFPGTIHPPQTLLSALGANAASQAASSRDSTLPPGVVIPEGWTLLPLHPLADLQGSSGFGQNTAASQPSDISPAQRNAPPTSLRTFEAQQSGREALPETIRVRVNGDHTTSPRANVSNLSPSGSGETGEPPIVPQAETSSQSAPQWSFASNAPSSSNKANSLASGESAQKESTEGSEVGQDGGKKGRGRATTVEDADETDETL